MDDPLAHLLESGLEESRHQRYALERELGHGSMGVVYAARDRLLERPVAVKVMAASLVQDPDLRRYFEREARAAARLSHRNVVVVHDFGYDPKGAPFVVMERLRGFDLRQALAGGQVPPLDRRLAVVLQVLAGLAHAHAADVVHRDVKPANVFLTEEGVVKLLDFGIARLARGGSGGQSSGEVMGTADYMSPEQVQGADDLDRRSDIFSCGALLFELLTGRPPFHSESFVTIAYRVVHEEPDYALLPPAAAPLVPVLQKAMAKARAHRFDSALDFATEIGLATGVGVAPDTIQPGQGWNVPLPFPRPPKPGTTVRLRKTWEEGPTRPLDPAALPAWPLRAPEEEQEAQEPALAPRRPRGRRRGPWVAGLGALALGASLVGWLWTRPAPAASAAPAAAATPRPAPTPITALSVAVPSSDPFDPPTWLSGGDTPLIPPPPASPAAEAGTAAPRVQVEPPRPAGPPWNRSSGRPSPVAVAAAAPPAPAPAEAPRIKIGRWTGYLTDETCREKGAVSDHGSCLAICLRRGARPMIAVDGELYWIRGIEHISGSNDRRVVVEGRLDLDRRTLTVASGGPAH
jgi:eukaryotic-like serine/threonine-protein kinase